MTKIMNPMDAIVDQSFAQKNLSVERMRAELKLLGYEVVTAEWLRLTLLSLPVARSAELDHA